MFLSRLKEKICTGLQKKPVYPVRDNIRVNSPCNGVALAYNEIHEATKNEENQ